MKMSVHHLTPLCSLLLALAGFSHQAAAAPLFSDNFEDRVKDQAVVGNNWTWYDQNYADDACTDNSPGGFGPFDDGDGSDYEVENRNYWTASEAEAGQGDSYFRAGLEVPAWDGALSNMLRVYGNQYNPSTTCQRVLIFQENTVTEAGNYVFRFDVAKDREGAPANGEVTAAFVKVLKSSDGSYETLIFKSVQTLPPAATTPEDVTTASMSIEFVVPEELVGELLQFGFYNDFSTNLDQSWGTSAALYDNVELGLMEIGPAHSGSFFNAGQSGHGFSIEFGELSPGMPFAVVYWYTYDDLGNPIFMLGNGVPVENTLEITFESPVGMEYGEFDPDTVVRETGGTAVFVFSDRDNATFSYTPSAFSMSEWGHTTPIVDLPLVKVFGIPADKYFNTSE